MRLRFGCVRWFALMLPLLCCSVAAAADDAQPDEEGFVSLFDGQSLDKWDGNPDFWRVEDGAIIGQTTPDNPTRGNTFLIYRGAEPGDFELKLEYKIIGGNSGIQYRSFEVPNNKWVVGGYQADFEAGDTYSGILYGERFRGILANRGQKTVIGEDGKPTIVGSVGDSKEIQSKIKKEDWNEYHITARGYHFVHRINGVVTCEATDEDVKTRRADGIIALQLHAGPPMKVGFRNIRLKKLAARPAAEDNSQAPAAQLTPEEIQARDLAQAQEQIEEARKSGDKLIVFIAGRPSHGYGAHEHRAGCLLLARQLEQGLPNVKTAVFTWGWPADDSALEHADAVVIYADGGGNHPAVRHLQRLDSVMQRGAGLVCLHYAVEVVKGEPGEHFLAWIGGYFEMNWSVNPHWTAHFQKLPKHPITRGVRPFAINDEWYYHMRFRPGLSGVTPILTDLPGPDTLKRPDGPHSGNPDVRKAVLEGMEPQHVAWATERPDGGRGFGFTGGHVHWNWGNDDFRKLVLNAIAWSAKIDVPEEGVPTPSVDLAKLKANQDFPLPANFNEQSVQQMLDSWKKS